MPWGRFPSAAVRGTRAATAQRVPSTATGLPIWLSARGIVELRLARSATGASCRTRRPWRFGRPFRLPVRRDPLPCHLRVLLRNGRLGIPGRARGAPIARTLRRHYPPARPERPSSSKMQAGRQVDAAGWPQTWMDCTCRVDPVKPGCRSSRKRVTMSVNPRILSWCPHASIQ